ncbi:MAG TPA: nickel pincer cofactor biosynthesis protein LarB [Candidatus Methylomirabilis sp.]|nr:nickel pincer cofactor biosynthesis protein LarB [Candidatus Methylomirabilis sp.]
MNRRKLLVLLNQVQTGKLSADRALHRLRHFPTEDLGFARMDNHRAIRQGFPEVIFCEGKTVAQATAIARRNLERHGMLLATRASRAIFKAIRAKAPRAMFHPLSRSIVVKPARPFDSLGRVLVLSAGTSDIPVAEEAAVTADILGSRVETLYDVGVAGLHRILDNRAALDAAQVVVVVAGMDGVLPSVVGGLVSKPVIAVPTSVGYGASFQGLAALLTMLNSCAAGIAVVNIDNGFGAGVLAHRINALATKSDRDRDSGRMEKRQRREQGPRFRKTIKSR